MMRTAALAVVLALALAGSATASAPGPAWHQLAGYTFEQYKLDFGKVYASTAEEAERRANFDASLALIRAHNADATKSWKLGVNQFTDLHREEARAMLGYHKQLGALRRASPPSTMLKWESARLKDTTAAREHWLPSQVDWRKDGVVSDVKNQGMCGSCWAFAAAEALESHLALKTGFLYTLSVQEFVSCMPNEHKCGGTGGCKGATAQLAFDFALENGLVDEWSYSYLSFHGDDSNADYCDAFQKDSLAVGHVTGHYDLPTNDQDALIEAVAFDGPVSISVDASTWHLYEEGVYDGCNQTNPDINHAVQLVGYGTDRTEGDYWLVRNSWGPTWGESGYIRLRRESTPRCGVDIHPLDGSGCEGGPPEVEACGTCGLLIDSSMPIIASGPTPEKALNVEAQPATA